MGPQQILEGKRRIQAAPKPEKVDVEQLQRFLTVTSNALLLTGVSSHHIDFSREGIPANPESVSISVIRTKEQEGSSQYELLKSKLADMFGAEKIKAQSSFPRGRNSSVAITIQVSPKNFNRRISTEMRRLGQESVEACRE